MRISNELLAGLGVGVTENAVKVVNLWHKANHYHWLYLYVSVKLPRSLSGETMNLRMGATKPVAQGGPRPRDQ